MNETQLKQRIKELIRKQSPEALVLPTLGVVRGFPDYLVIERGIVYCIEVKSKRGKLSDVQKARIQQLKELGIETIVINDIEQIKQRL